MDLVFENVNGKYVAAFTATGDFNLHIEKPGGIVNIYQSTVDGASYDNIDGASISSNIRVFDEDFTALVYPKHIKLIAEELPTMAVVTAGEGAEVGYSEAQISETLNTPV